MLESPEALPALWEDLTVDFSHELITGRLGCGRCWGSTGSGATACPALARLPGSPSAVCLHCRRAHASAVERCSAERRGVPRCAPSLAAAPAACWFAWHIVLLLVMSGEVAQQAILWHYIAVLIMPPPWRTLPPLQAFAAVRLQSHRLVDFVRARCHVLRRLMLTNSEGYWVSELCGHGAPI